TLYQWTGGRARRVLRPGRSGHRRLAASRATARRRLELRGRQRLSPVVVQHDDLRARGHARARTGRRRQPGGDRRPSARAGVPPRETPLPAAVDRRGDRARSQGRRRVDTLRLPARVATLINVFMLLPAGGMLALNGHYFLTASL